MPLGEEMEQDLSCPVCRDIYKDPLVLSCSHSVCRTCLHMWWREKHSQECPVCRKRSRSGEWAFVENLVLRNLCDAVLHERTQTDLPEPEEEPVCPLHGEKLERFCLDDEQLICRGCQTTPHEHVGHDWRRVPTAARNLKRELRTALKPIEEQMRTLFSQYRLSCDQTADLIMTQAQQTERQIKVEFEKLHKFLREEEEARIAALREEEVLKSRLMEEEHERLSRETAELSDTIRTIKEELRATDISFLQNYQATADSIQVTLPDLKLGPGALIDVAKHLGNLTFRVWEKMVDIVTRTPVILDPNTVFPQFSLSKDLTAVRCFGGTQQVPNNPERFNANIALSHEGFTSGSNTWDVEVGDCPLWHLGVLAESVDRNELVGDIWRLWLHNNVYKAEFSSNPAAAVDVPAGQNPRRIRVTLDWDNGKLSFSDPDQNRHLYTFNHNFAERIFPFVGAASLRILPDSVSVMVTQPPPVC